MQEAWFFANKENLIKKLELNEYPYNPPYLYYLRDGVEEVWENTKANRWFLNKLKKKLKSDDKFFLRVYKNYFTKLKKIETWRQKNIKSIGDLKKFITEIFEATSDFVIIYEALMYKAVRGKYQKLAKKFREQDEFFAQCNVALLKALDNIYPKLGYLTIYITREELGKKILTKELLRRSEGFVLIPGVFQETMDFESLIKKFPQYHFKIEKIQRNKNGLTGQSAYKGRVSGKVRIVKRMDQANQVVSGEIIVSPMTTPDFMPAMKKAAAFVTDEGGITCHAAIIAREMKKPCLIGTKIATKILKDGDLVEVDAIAGIVKILK